MSMSGIGHVNTAHNSQSLRPFSSRNGIQTSEDRAPAEHEPKDQRAEEHPLNVLPQSYDATHGPSVVREAEDPEGPSTLSTNKGLDYPQRITSEDVLLQSRDELQTTATEKARKSSAGPHLAIDTRRDTAESSIVCYL